MFEDDDEIEALREENAAMKAKLAAQEERLRSKPTEETGSTAANGEGEAQLAEAPVKKALKAYEEAISNGRAPDQAQAEYFAALRMAQTGASGS